MSHNRPLFRNPFDDSDDEPEREKREKAEKPERTCPSGRRLVKGFTRKDGRKVAPFCALKREPQASLSGVLKGTAIESKKAVEKMVGEQGCAEVLKKLEFLGRVSQDETVRKHAKEQAEALRAHPSCKIPRKKEEEKGAGK